MAQINGQIILASNVAATGAGFAWKGGKGVFTAEATWGGGTVKLEMQTVNGTWVTVFNPNGNAVSMTANGMISFEAPPGQIRANIATATAVFAYAIGNYN